MFAVFSNVKLFKYNDLSGLRVMMEKVSDDVESGGRVRLQGWF